MHSPYLLGAKKEKRFATLLVLAKLLDNEMSGEHNFFACRNDNLPNIISNSINLDDISHKIDSNLLFEISSELSSERIVSSSDLDSCYITDIDKLKQKITDLNSVGVSLEKMREYYNSSSSDRDEIDLQSIHLITKSLAVGDVIFLVFNELYKIPFRFNTKNNKGGHTYIKKLHDIAYPVDVPGKKVSYNERLADNINNGLFKRRAIRDYMKTNKFKKPTLVQKSEDGKALVLKNTIPVEIILINTVPLQHRSLYLDKTK